MKIRKIDSNSDIILGKGLSSYNEGDNAIAENIQTRLMSFLNDCWFDMTFGIDWFRLLGSRNTRNEIELTVRSVILASFGVTQLNNLDVNFDSITRSMTISGNMNTVNSVNVPLAVEVLV